MIKFEVGKVYKRLDYEENKAELVVSRKDCLIRTIKPYEYEEYGTRYSLVWQISEIDGIEKIMSDDTTILSADELCYGKATQEPEVKEEDKKEEKEEVQEDSDDWIIGKEYEGICLKTKQRFKAVFVEDDGDDRDGYPLRFKLPFKDRESDTFNDYGNAAESCFDSDEIIIFKHGIKSILDWEEAKEERKPVRFEDGKIYKGLNEELFTCKTTFITANNEKVGIFYNENKDAVLAQKIQNKNNVEYTYFMNTDQLDFIADEQYRDEIKALL